MDRVATIVEKVSKKESLRKNNGSNFFGGRCIFIRASCFIALSLLTAFRSIFRRQIVHREVYDTLPSLT